MEIFEVLLERSPISNYDFPRLIFNQALKMIPNILEDREISVIFSRNFMNLLPFLVDLASKKQWEQFIDLILTQPDEGKSSSIWYKYFSGYEHHRFQFRLHLWKRTQRKMGHYNITFEDLLLDEDEFGEVDLFLRCVSEKLGDFDVQRLVCQCKTLIDLKESTGKQKYLKCVVLGEATLS